MTSIRDFVEKNSPVIFTATNCFFSLQLYGASLLEIFFRLQIFFACLFLNGLKLENHPPGNSAGDLFMMVKT